MTELDGTDAGADDVRTGAPERGRWPSRWHSLRGRASIAFGALAFVLSMMTALGVWLAVSGFLMLQRERTAETQAVANAAQLYRTIESEGLDPTEALARLPREIGAAALLVDDGRWYTTSLDIGRTQVPAGLRTTVLDDGLPARQRVPVNGGTMLAVGVPLPDGAYFAVLSLHELSRTLRVLAVVLVSTVALVPVAAVSLGWWVTQSALRPLARLSQAAAGVAAGDTATRIDPRGDPALIPIAASFNATAAALERRVRADARFATDVAHELRSPLTTMLTAVSLVGAEREHLDQDGQEALDLLEAEVERFSRLVQDLLEMSRSDAGDADFAPVDVRLAELVEQALPVSLRRLLVVDGPAADVRVEVDKRRFERVVANLVDNAEQHGGGLRAVTVARRDDMVHLWVDDAGPGVPLPDRERIFERFTRGTDSERGDSRGVGLGLALVVGHLQPLRAQVWVEDSPEGGARFAIALPVKELP